MKQFRSIEKIDTAILYTLELTSSISVLLLAFGLIASMANVLTQGSVLTDNLLMQRVWAWTQCIVSLPRFGRVGEGKCGKCYVGRVS